MDQVSFNLVHRFDQTLSTRANRLRKEARGTPYGVRRNALLHRAQQIESASSIQEPLVSPELQLFK
jgi:hypothetical protein